MPSGLLHAELDVLDDDVAVGEIGMGAVDPAVDDGHGDAPPAHKITSGGGGMLVTDREDWGNRARYLTTQAKVPDVGYLHDEVV